MIIGVSAGEGEGGYVNEISEKFPAAEMDADSQIYAKTLKFTSGLGTR